MWYLMWYGVYSQGYIITSIRNSILKNWTDDTWSMCNNYWWANINKDINATVKWGMEINWVLFILIKSHCFPYCNVSSKGTFMLFETDWTILMAILLPSQYLNTILHAWVFHEQIYWLQSITSSWLKCHLIQWCSTLHIKWNFCLVLKFLVQFE